MKFFYEKLLRWARLRPSLRAFANRYGRSYWHLPASLRKGIYWEDKVRKLAGVETLTVGEPESVAPISSQHEAVRHPPTFEHRFAAKGYRLPAPTVARLPQAWLVGQYASPVTCNGRLILSAFREEPRLLGLERHSDLEAWMKDRAWKGKSDLPPLEHIWSMVSRVQTNYFHWIVEWCGRLEWLEAYRRQTNRAPRLLIPKEGPNYIRASLHLLGYGAEDLLEWPNDSPPRAVKDFLIPSFRGTTSASSPGALRWLRKRLLNAVGVTEVRAWRKIYIARRADVWRGVINSAEVEEMLRGEGFEILEPHALPLEKQIRIFSEARLIVGLHGSGLTNILFSPQAVMLEIFGSYGDGVWCSMTSRLGQRYEAMRCEPIGDNVVVDLKTLKQRVASF